MFRPTLPFLAMSIYTPSVYKTLPNLRVLILTITIVTTYGMVMVTMVSPASELLSSLHGAPCPRSLPLCPRSLPLCPRSLPLCPRSLPLCPRSLPLVATPL